MIKPRSSPSIAPASRSLKQELIIISLILTSVLVFLFGYFGLALYQFYQERSSLILARESARIEEAFRFSLASTKDTMEQLNKQIVENNLNNKLFSTFKIEDNASNMLSWNMFSWITPSLKLTVNSKKGILDAPIDVSSREYVQTMQDQPWTAVFSPIPVIGMVSGEYILTCGMGATLDNGRFAGGLIIGFSLDGIMKRIETLIQSPGIDFMLIGTKNLPVAWSKSAQNWSPSTNFLRALELKKNQRLYSGTLSENTRIIPQEYKYFRVANSDYILVLRHNPDFSYHELLNSFVPRLVELMIILSSIPLIFLWGKHRVINPIILLTNHAHNLAEDEPTKELPKFQTAEFQSLSTQLHNIAHYIAERKATELELVKKTEIAENAVKAKSDFLSCITHELRTPLNAIIGYASIQTKELYGPLGHPKYYDYVKDIQSAGSHLLGLIDTILDYVRADEGNLQIRYEDIDIVKLLHESITIALDIIEEKKLNITIEADTNIPYLISDRIRLKQIIINILSNAIKFMSSQKQITISVKIHRSANKTRQFLLLINDSGSGIKEDDIERIIHPFQQGESGLNRRYGGVGLGLPLSQKLIEILGGTFLIESVFGVGTTVIISFPENFISPHRPRYHVS
ncbi:MAG: hypothetical protein IPP74_09800 [Alphaproteobacteria bacterium]|nr:hypothetical protein [Alphaproteobacteria bacterium]